MDGEKESNPTNVDVVGIERSIKTLIRSEERRNVCAVSNSTARIGYTVVERDSRVGLQDRRNEESFPNFRGSRDAVAVRTA